MGDKTYTEWYADKLKKNEVIRGLTRWEVDENDLVTILPGERICRAPVGERIIDDILYENNTICCKVLNNTNALRKHAVSHSSITLRGGNNGKPSNQEYEKAEAEFKRMFKAHTAKPPKTAKATPNSGAGSSSKGKGKAKAKAAPEEYIDLTEDDLEFDATNEDWSTTDQDELCHYPRSASNKPSATVALKIVEAWGFRCPCGPCGGSKRKTHCKFDNFCLNFGKVFKFDPKTLALLYKPYSQKEWEGVCERKQEFY